MFHDRQLCSVSPKIWARRGGRKGKYAQDFPGWRQALPPSLAIGKRIGESMAPGSVTKWPAGGIRGTAAQ
jgi:hypothetical protein